MRFDLHLTIPAPTHWACIFCHYPSDVYCAYKQPFQGVFSPNIAVPSKQFLWSLPMDFHFHLSRYCILFQVACPMQSSWPMVSSLVPSQVASWTSSSRAEDLLTSQEKPSVASMHVDAKYNNLMMQYSLNAQIPSRSIERLLYAWKCDMRIFENCCIQEENLPSCKLTCPSWNILYHCDLSQVSDLSGTDCWFHCSCLLPFHNANLLAGKEGTS